MINATFHAHDGWTHTRQISYEIHDIPIYRIANYTSLKPALRQLKDTEEIPPGPSTKYREFKKVALFRCNGEYYAHYEEI